MTKKFFLLLLICLPVLTQAQYTEVINSNRPGFSESPYSVGVGVYQFESSLFFRKADAVPTFSNPQALGLNLHFRTGLFLEKLEFNLSTSLQQDKIAFKNVFESSHNETGLGQFTLGAKYLVYKPTYTDKGKVIRSWNKRHSFDFKRWIPHVAVYAGVNFGSFLNDYHENGGLTPKAGILLQNEFSNQFNLVTNVYYNYIGSDFSEWSYILTATYNFNDHWSGFAEHQALFGKQETQSNLGGGVAYLFNKNLQINASLRATFQEESLGFYSGVGVSYRIDNHVDEFIELDEFGNKIEAPEKATYNKGFFGRLFDKIGGIFKKKDKTTPDLDTEKAKTETEANTGGRKRKKSVLGDLIKDDKKSKKKTTKAEKRAERKAKKAEEKAKRKLEREQQKEEKRKRKEQEKLEKEIKKLEKELQKEEEKEKEKELQEKYEEEKKKQKENKKDD